MISNLKIPAISPLILLILLFTLLSLGILFQILSLILLGAMIAYLVRPIAQKILPYVKFETLAIFLAMILLATPLVIIIYFTIDQILLLASDIMGALPTSGNVTLTNDNATLQIASAKNLGSFDQLANDLIKQIANMVGQFIVWMAGQIIKTIAYIPALFTDLIILLFSIFYFAKEGDKFVQFLKDILPKEKSFQKLYAQVDDILKSIMIVNIVCAVLLGLLSVVLYYILGYPYILLLGIVTAISEFIPVVGPWIVYGTLGIVDIITGNYLRGILVILFGWLIDTVVDMYIRPKLAGKYTEVHPLVFLVGFLFGAITLGLPGLFIGPLIVGIASVLYHLYREEKIKGTA